MTLMFFLKLFPNMVFIASLKYRDDYLQFDKLFLSESLFRFSAFTFPISYLACLSTLTKQIVLVTPFVPQGFYFSLIFCFEF